MASSQQPAGPPARRLRADAARNREAVLCAAREVFAENGLDSPLEEIARRARVGIGTLYRRFPSREHLISAALVGKITEYAEAAEHALAVPDPWTGFAEFVHAICVLQADDRGLADLLLITMAPSGEIEAIRDRANRASVQLIDRAKAAGKVRADVTGEDLLLLLIANSSIAAAAGKDAPGALPRFVALMLDAFRAGQTSVLPMPPSSAQMRRVMARMAAEYGCSSPLAGEHELCGGYPPQWPSGTAEPGLGSCLGGR